MFKKGFTLTEILVALAIIGVISALTMPGLINNYQEKIFVTQLERVYNEVSKAVSQLMTDESVDDLTESSLVDDPEGFLNKYFDVSYVCGDLDDNSSAPNCFAASYRSLDKSESGGAAIDGTCVYLNTNASLCIDAMNPRTYNDDGTYDHEYSQVLVDVNGPEPPNIEGRDLFSFDIYDNGAIREAYDLEGAMSTDADFSVYSDKCLGRSETFNGYGAGCFTKIMEDNWKMDY